MVILGIETSCDDTCVAVVENGQRILSNIVFRQDTLHSEYGGVVPEMAARKHVEVLLPTLDRALAESGKRLGEIDAIAATTRPGLMSALLAGVNTAKTLSYALDKPLFSVNHLMAHFYALSMGTKISYPYIGLLVSGGHTLLTKVSSALEVEILGSTLDDACGECFDKIAKSYALGYPGGAALEKAAMGGNATTYDFPASFLPTHENPYDFSYSGLKTAVIHHKERYRKAASVCGKELADLFASFQKAAFSPLLKKSIAALRSFSLREIGVCGGVSANSKLRFLFKGAAVTAYFPPLSLCQDNAAMVAGLAYKQHQLEGKKPTFSIEASSESFKYSKKL